MLDMVDIDEFPKSKNALADIFEQTKWIPVSEKLPTESKFVIVSVLAHEYIQDYYIRTVPEDKKIYHPERLYTTVGVYENNRWSFFPDYWDIDINETFLKDETDPRRFSIGYLCEEIIAWMPLPEPYTDKKASENQRQK